MRISKAPEVRKREIMEAAMEVFMEKGYENTSMADIAGRIHVVQGLCYRYFPSKQALFENAVDAYVEELCVPFAAILHDSSLTVSERMDKLCTRMTDPEEGRFHTFFHEKGNEPFHELLSLKMCRRMLPEVVAELERLCRDGKIRLPDVRSAAEFAVYGQLPLWQAPPERMQEKMQAYRRMIGRVLELSPERKKFCTTNE